MEENIQWKQCVSFAQTELCETNRDLLRKSWGMDVKKQKNKIETVKHRKRQEGQI